MYYVVCSILNESGDDLSAWYKRKQESPTDEAAKKPHTARELLIEQFFMPMVVGYLKDSKCEAFTFMATNEMAAFLAEAKVTMSNTGHYELNKMSKENYIKFRYYFAEERMCHKVWTENKNEKAMDLLLSIFVLVLCKKIPAECGIPKIENLHNKVKLLCPHFFLKEQPKTDAAVIRVTHHSKATLKEPPLSPNSNQTADADAVAYAMNGRISALPYTVVIINQNAARCVREDFVNAMVKSIPDYFKEDTKNGKKILVRAEHLYAEQEEAYIAAKCSTYELPYFDIPHSEIE